MKILITGGAGYIGSHIALKLLKKGYLVIAIDNLSSGFIEPIKILSKKFNNLEFIRGDISDKEFLEKFFKNQKIDAVMHLAAKIDTAESVKKPELYHRENYLNGINLIEAMTLAGVNKIIFSSTAAVYGNPQYIPIDENHPTLPLSPYGQTKLDFEKYLTKTKNLQYIILRYFNVGGADPEELLGKSHLKSKDLLESLIKVALGQKEYLPIFGRDYKTADGTAIRDFLHVDDIAEAHLLALEKIDRLSGKIFNLGSEKGFSVQEVVDKANSIIGKDIAIKNMARRPGDIAISVASSAKAKKILGWNPNYSNLDSIIQTDWNWRRTHPLGYTE
jgi:UDP-glucose 4-epimerase